MGVRRGEATTLTPAAGKVMRVSQDPVPNWQEDPDTLGKNALGASLSRKLLPALRRTTTPSVRGLNRAERCARPPGHHFPSVIVDVRQMNAVRCGRMRTE